MKRAEFAKHLVAAGVSPERAVDSGADIQNMLIMQLNRDAAVMRKQLATMISNPTMDNRNWLGNVLVNTKGVLGYIGTAVGFAANVDTIMGVTEYMDNSFIFGYPSDCDPGRRVDEYVFDVEIAK
ncbi:hypothetical protein [Teredinibacter turnerae]|uniref:hypothetical protein n=1 Tax=Teredinibacter turnerae TaxID=2426 RepID=UPI0030D531C4